MNPFRYRRRSSLPDLLPFAGGAAIALLLVALVVSSLFVRTEYRYTRLRVGEARILERDYPVSDVEVLRPEVASTEIDPHQGLVVRAHQGGLAEVIFDRADGKRFHYFVEVRKNRPIQVSLAPARRKTRVARKSPEERKLRREPKKEPPPLPEAKPKGQVVEIDKPAVQQRPAESKYLSEYDSKVREEMRSRERSRRLARAQPLPPSPPVPPSGARRPEPPAPASRTQPARGARGDRQAVGKVQEGPQGERGPELPKVALGPPRGEEAPQPRPEREGREEPGIFRREAGPERIDITPRPEVIAQAVGAGSPDYLKGVQEGNRNTLNTKSWIGASFFNRVKRAVAQHWNPGEVYRRRDPYGNIYGIKDRYTLVHVTLNGDGTLKNLKVLNPSGIDFLDEEAVGAIEAAQPFPNPPVAVRDKDGFIRFGFGFYFEVSDRPLFRIYRYND